jgi:hypothetical protein
MQDEGGLVLNLETFWKAPIILDSRSDPAHNLFYWREMAGYFRQFP